jgi:hypothetical protein
VWCAGSCWLAGPGLGSAALPAAAVAVGELTVITTLQVYHEGSAALPAAAVAAGESTVITTLQVYHEGSAA